MQRRGCQARLLAFLALAAFALLAAAQPPLVPTESRARPRSQNCTSSWLCSPGSGLTPLSHAQVVFETCRKHQDAGVQENSARAASWLVSIFLVESTATPLTAGARAGFRQARMHRR